MTDSTKNISASIKARLNNIAKREGTDFEHLLMLYMLERFLHRLSISKYSSNFILKGGLLLYVKLRDKGRPTKDIDFLARQIANNTENIAEIIKDICLIEEDDGLRFDTKSIIAEKIKEDEEYEGVRISCYIEKTFRVLQLDIGFDDVIVPKPVEMSYPVLLDMESPNICAYSMESVVAEKFEAMTELAELNGRIKDFYDIYVISENYDFDGRILYEAVFETFQKRGTNLNKEHIVFKDEFFKNEIKQKQWEAFIKRNKKIKIDFDIIMRRIKVFLEPIYQAVINENEFFKIWDNKRKNWI